MMSMMTGANDQDDHDGDGDSGDDGAGKANAYEQT